MWALTSLTPASVVATTKKNANVALVFQFLHRTVQVSPAIVQLYYTLGWGFISFQMSFCCYNIHIVPHINHVHTVQLYSDSSISTGLCHTASVCVCCAVVQVFCEYFKELEEESIRDNFVIIYELLDELMDFGFPQTTDSKILQEWVAQIVLTSRCRAGLIMYKSKHSEHMIDCV